MKKLSIQVIVCIFTACAAIASGSGCNKKMDFLKNNQIPLAVVSVDDDSGGSSGTGSSNGGGGGSNPDAPGDNPDGAGGGNTPNKPTGPDPSGGGIAMIPLDMVINDMVDPNTGLKVEDDYDADGVTNLDEYSGNPYVADYPCLVTRVTAPIFMMIEEEVDGEKLSTSETLTEDSFDHTINNSMDFEHYTQLNQKTTPYVTKEAYSNSAGSSNSWGASDANSFGYNYSNEYSFGYGVQSSLRVANVGVSLGFNTNSSNKTSMGLNTSTSTSINRSVSDNIASSKSSEKTVFQDVDYKDNLDRDGYKMKDDAVQKMSQRFRNSTVMKNITKIGSKAGLVRTAFYIKNPTKDMPVRISNVRCTLSFRTPAGKFLPVKDFFVRNDDYTPFGEEIYGDEEKGPYVIELTGLNTKMIMDALTFGYIPQVTIVSYDMKPVKNTNYRPGMENLKMIEEGAKKRTAVIKIIGSKMRETYRVAAVDVGDDGTITNGISLKKALFNILADRIGNREDWKVDCNGDGLTVADTGLKWKFGAEDRSEYIYGDNKKGNSWTMLETYVKTYTDEFNQVHRMEAIRRIGKKEQGLVAYNPFDKEDNPAYNENELLPSEEIRKMKYWVVLHNGRYYNGDINDPIVAGERYEIVCADVGDFNEHFDAFSFTPLQTQEQVYLNTRWNKLVNGDIRSRARYMGRVNKGDVINLKVKIDETRHLFDRYSCDGAGVGAPQPIIENYIPIGNKWNNFAYTIQPETPLPSGIPGGFDHYAEGGVNGFKVSISESINAHYYIVTFGRIGDGTYQKKIRIEAADLLAADGVLYVNSRTGDENGTPIGVIPGGSYWVDVTACGKFYGVPVATRSAKNNFHRDDPARAETSVVVTQATEVLPYSGFNFSVRGAFERIYVMISPNLNTEYFLIKCTGPGNYQDADSSEILQRGHVGLNEIAVPHPYASDPSREAMNPGLYRVQVFAVNANCANEDPVLLAKTESRSGEVYASVNYAIYRNQRKMAPIVSGMPESLTDIDLEVNFNDGSGWWRLKLANDDLRTNGREIDCRLTSYMEQDEQVFHISFEPPSSVTDSWWSVFGGSNDSVKMYIRTVAENRYRDTFWMREIPVGDAASGIIIKNTDIDNFIQYWVSREETDASNFTKTLQSWRVTSPDSVGEGGIGLIDGGNPARYFFSPLEERRYYVSATLSQDFMVRSQPPSKVDYTRFNACAGPQRIFLDGMHSMFAEYYTVYWKECPPGPVCNTASMGGVDSTWGSAIVNAGQENLGFVIPSLRSDLKYIVAVKGGAAGMSDSELRYYGDKYETGDNPVTVAPFTNIPPRDAPGFTVPAVSGSAASITVSNIFLAGYNRYLLEWKARGDSEWTGRCDSRQLGPQTGPWSFDVTGLESGTLYDFRASAMAWNGLQGPLSGVQSGSTTIGSVPVLWASAHESSIDVALTWLGNFTYSIEWRNITNGSGWTTVTLTSNTGTISGLATGNTYEIIGHVCSPTVCGPDSAVITINTSVNGSPTVSAVVEGDRSSMVVTVAMPGSSGNVIEYRERGFSTWIATDNSGRITGLTPGNRYYVRAYATFPSGTRSSYGYSGEVWIPMDIDFDVDYLDPAHPSSVWDIWSGSVHDLHNYHYGRLYLKIKPPAGITITSIGGYVNYTKMQWGLLRYDPTPQDNVPLDAVRTESDIWQIKQFVSDDNPLSVTDVLRKTTFYLKDFHANSLTIYSVDKYGVALPARKMPFEVPDPFPDLN